MHEFLPLSEQLACDSVTERVQTAQRTRRGAAPSHRTRHRTRHSLASGLRRLADRVDGLDL